MIEQSQVDQVCRRIHQLRQSQTYRDRPKEAIRLLCGPPDQALNFLLGSLGDVSEYSVPAANLVLSGLRRLAQKIGRVPDLRVPTPIGDEKDSTRKRVEKRARIITSWDDTIHANGPEYGDCLENTLYQSGMWLPGYTFTTWVVKEGKTHDGDPYPALINLDPYGTYPSSRDCAYVYGAKLGDLATRYPQHRAKLLGQRQFGGAVLLDPSDQPMQTGNTWLGQASNFNTPGGSEVDVVEYYNDEACWVVVPSKNLLLEYYANPLSSPQFITTEMFSFGQPVGQYDHTIGLQAQIASFNALAAIAMKDAVHTEALALDTPVPTPTGWTTMGEIVDGDVILGADGLPVEVDAAKPVQHARDCYTVTFEDGTSVVASDGHLWASKGINHQIEKVRTTREMYESANKFRVPASKPWKLPEVDLPVDPYILGMWLGDGRSQGPIITADTADMPHVIDQIEAAGLTAKPITQADRAPAVYVAREGSGKGQHGTGLHGALRTLGLLGNKHVPPVYLRGSIDQRTALVQGLMDSDGTANVRGHCHFANSKRSLIDAMVELLRSLGEVPGVYWFADERSRQGGYWTVAFTPRNIQPFRLPRKAARIAGHRRSPDWVTIKSIEPAPSVPVRCIAVANDDHLFLAGIGGHVTHNTNVFGELLSGQYRKGRFAVNYFTPGTRIEKPASNLPYQLFQELDRLEKQFRTTAGYSPVDDAISPAAQATGQGIDRLTAGIDLEVKQFLSLLRRSTQLADRKRLEWMEKCHPDTTIPLEGMLSGQAFNETYTPRRDIKGNYRTRRTYGAMAGLDDQNKISALLLLKQGEMLDSTSAMEELDLGGRSVTQVQERIEDEKIRRTLMEAMATGQPMDPRVAMTLIEMLPASPFKTAAQKFWSPQGEQMSPEEQALADMAAAPQGPPDIMSMLGMAPEGGMPPEMAGAAMPEGMPV